MKLAISAITQIPTNIHSEIDSGFISAMLGAVIVITLAKKLQKPYDVAIIWTGNSIWFPRYARLNEDETPNLLPKINNDSKNY
mgnify:CR=1 FL=1